MQDMALAAAGVVGYLTALYYVDQHQKTDAARRLFRAISSIVTLALAVFFWTRVANGPVVLNKLSPAQVGLFVIGASSYFSVAYFVHDVLPAAARTLWRYLILALSIAAFGAFLQELVPTHKRAVEISKATISIIAAGCVFYEQHRKGQGRPIAERWKRLVGITLALAAITGYFNGFKFGYPPYYHRWDQYHYYMGAKYFPELGYTDLYKCGVVAQDDLGKMPWTGDHAWTGKAGRTSVVDMSKEVRDPDKKVRELGGENLLIPGSVVLTKDAERCRSKFSDGRWKEYKADIAFFRVTSGKGYWTDMQKDHGFNPPPVWTIAGKIFSDINPAQVNYMQFLASLDLLYIIGMFVALWWGFGWRVFAVGAIFWGCQASAPFYWTGGAFLRQDWLFFSVLSIACMRKKHFKIAGAALVYAGLLRIFPGLVVIGTLVPTIAYALKHKKMHADHKQMLLGGTMAAAVLLGGGALITGTNSYKTFYEHTLQTHDKTPLTNHMGLRVLIGHKFIDLQTPGLRTAEEASKAAGEGASGVARTLARVKWPIKLSTGKSSGHMQWVRDNRRLDPFEMWKKMRNERYHKYRYFAYALILGSLFWFIAVVRRIKSLWIAQCLGQIFIILLSQLTCYYYSFMILGAPLIKARKQIQVGLFATAAITQIIWMNGTVYGVYNDHKYTLLTYASLIWCYVMIGLFWRRSEGLLASRTVEHDTEDPEPVKATS